MCGIAGVRRYGTDGTPINREELYVMLCALERRGNHSTGIALLNRDEAGVATLVVHKAPLPAWSFTREKETEDWLDENLSEQTTIALLHTRFATVGNPMDNRNNHPITDGKIAIVHNGGISNQISLFGTEKMDRSCETDSDIIRALLSKYNLTKEGLDALNKMNGSAAIAAVSVEQPDVLLLARSGSPLTYGFNEDKLWWASEMGAIQKAVRPWVKGHGLYGRKSRADIAYHGMLDDTAYLLGPDGIQHRQQFKSCGQYHAPTYSGMHDNYNSRMNTWKRQNNTTVVIPPTTIHRVALPATIEAEPVVVRKRYKVAPCPKCGASLKHECNKNWKGFVCTVKVNGIKCYQALDALDQLKDHELTWED